MPNRAQSSAPGGTSRRRGRLLYICDWLPPDYGAVGQYSLLFARELAEEGRDVTLVGLSSEASSDRAEDCGAGSLRQIRLFAPVYDKGALLRRLLWTAQTNTRLLWHVRHELRESDVILFTGSPPYLLHWLAPLNLFLRKKLIYRITDFHPECLMAQSKTPGPALRLIYQLTLFWRRRVDEFEVLGHDQMERLAEAGIRKERMRLKRDPSPVAFDGTSLPLPRPSEAHGKLLLLYSGNWGVAHDYRTFIAGYAMHHREGTGRFVLWLNAVGGAVKAIEAELTRQKLPYIRGTPVPLEQLARLLLTPDAHLITLSDAFVGLVLPSKVHACIESQRPVLYIGSARSDVHRLCTERMRTSYRRVEAGNSEGCWEALEDLAGSIGRKAAGCASSHQHHLANGEWSSE
jgi:hypothetical protein